MRKKLRFYTLRPGMSKHVILSLDRTGFARGFLGSTKYDFSLRLFKLDWPKGEYYRHLGWKCPFGPPVPYFALDITLAEDERPSWLTTAPKRPRRPLKGPGFGKPRR